MHIYTINKVYITTLPTKDNFLSLSFQKKKIILMDPWLFLVKIDYRKQKKNISDKLKKSF